MSGLRFSDEEAAQILAKAAHKEAEISGISRDDLVALAAEAGISAEAVDLVIQERMARPAAPSPQAALEDGQVAIGQGSSIILDVLSRRSPFSASPLFRRKEEAVVHIPRLLSHSEVDQAERILTSNGFSVSRQGLGNLAALGRVHGSQVQLVLIQEAGRTTISLRAANNWAPTGAAAAGLIGLALTAFILRSSFGLGEDGWPLILMVLCSPMLIPVFAVGFYQAALAKPAKRLRQVLASLASLGSKQP